MNYNNTIVSKEDCLKILHRLFSDDYKLIDYKVQDFGSEPLGFLGSHSKLVITVSLLNTQNVLKFFMKSIPCATEAQKAYVLNIGVFKKEALLYKNLFVKLQNLTDQWSPTCYFVNPDSYFILEDLSRKGFAVVKDKSQTLDFAHCKCLTETLAKFHVSSIIFEELNSLKDEKPYRIYDHYKDILFETTFSWDANNARCDWLKITTETLIAVCSKIKEFQDVNVSEPIKKLVEEMKIFISPSKKFRNVINHGDLWSNNIMFNYKNGVANKCILVDFQMARYVPPSFDFLTFLYLTTSKHFHETNFNNFVDIYYSNFETELKKHNINPENIFTKKQFLECCEFYKSAALLEAAMFATIVYLNGDFSKNMLNDSQRFDDFMKKNRSKLVCELFDEDMVYRNRLESVITQLLNHIL